MMWRQLVLSLCLVAVAFVPAAAKPLFGFSENPAQAVEQGKTLPPQGYVKFCGSGQAECRFKGGKAERIVLNTETWDEISQVNHYVNTKIRPASDIELYGVPDLWTYPVNNAGDCEDYVLQKKRMLVDLGLNPDELLITVVLDENRQGHAVLTIMADKGDYVLDNRRNDILRWDSTGYTYLKRQSQAEATQWVSLQKGPSPTVASTKSR